jgi:hypothetical protein
MATQLYHTLPAMLEPRIRKQFGNTTKFAKAIGESQSTLHKFLTQSVNTRWQIVAKVLDALGVRIVFPDEEASLVRHTELEAEIVRIFSERRKWSGLKSTELNAVLDDLVESHVNLTIHLADDLCRALGTTLPEVVAKASFDLAAIKKVSNS